MSAVLYIFLVEGVYICATHAELAFRNTVIASLLLPCHKHGITCTELHTITSWQLEVMHNENPVTMDIWMAMPKCICEHTQENPNECTHYRLAYTHLLKVRINWNKGKCISLKCKSCGDVGAEMKHSTSQIIQDRTWWTCNPLRIYIFYCSWAMDDIVACHHRSLHILWLHWLLALPYSHQIYILQVFCMEVPISIETRKYLCSKTGMFSCIICIWYDMYIMRVRSEAEV